MLVSLSGRRSVAISLLRIIALQLEPPMQIRYIKLYLYIHQFYAIIYTIVAVVTGDFMKKHLNFGALVSLVALVFTIGIVPADTASAAGYTDVRYKCNTTATKYTWTVARNVSAPAGPLVVYKNGGTLYCAVHYNTSGKPLYMGATISYGSTEKNDYGYFSSYAGPVVVSIPKGRCGVATGYVVLRLKSDGTPGMAAVNSASVCNPSISAL